MIFPYLAIPPDPVPRPLLSVTFHGPSASKQELMVVDSGADTSVLPVWVGELLGISFVGRDRESFEIADGTATQACLIDVRVEVCGSRFTMPVAFLDNINVSPLLGQKGLFDHFRVCFHRYDSYFEVLPRLSRSAP